MPNDQQFWTIKERGDFKAAEIERERIRGLAILDAKRTQHPKDGWYEIGHQDRVHFSKDGHEDGWGSSNVIGGGYTEMHALTGCVQVPKIIDPGRWR